MRRRWETERERERESNVLSLELSQHGPIFPLRSLINGITRIMPNLTLGLEDGNAWEQVHRMANGLVL